MQIKQEYNILPLVVNNFKGDDKSGEIQPGQVVIGYISYLPLPCIHMSWLSSWYPGDFLYSLQVLNIVGSRNSRIHENFDQFSQKSDHCWPWDNRRHSWCGTKAVSAIPNNVSDNRVIDNRCLTSLTGGLSSDGNPIVPQLSLFTTAVRYNHVTDLDNQLPSWNQTYICPFVHLCMRNGIRKCFTEYSAFFSQEIFVIPLLLDTAQFER